MNAPRRGERRRVLGAAAAALLVPGAARAQAPFPSQPVRIIVPFSPGGAADSLPRMLGQKLSEMWGQPVLVENRPGAAGNIGMEQGARAAPNGYTLISAPTGNLVVNPHLFPNLGFDVFRSFVPVTLIGNVQNVLVVHPSVNAKSVAELVALAKRAPGQMSFGSGGSGSQAHIGVELLKAATSTYIVHIPYKGVSDMLRDLIGGQLSMALAQLPSVLPHIQSGRLRALGVASRVRTPILPDLPTIAESPGLPGFESISWYSLVAPAGTPRDVVMKIQGDVAQVLRSPEMRDRFTGLGVEPVGGSPEALAAVMRADFERYGAVIKRVGIKGE